MGFIHSAFSRFSCVFTFIITGLLPGFAGISKAASSNRITRAVDANRVQALTGNVHPLARTQFDRGLADASLPLGHIMLLFKPSAAQQTELDKLLAAQQNPSSPDFHKWLSPEEYANRFGLNTSDHSKVVSWLQSQGLTVNESGRGRNWVAFSGTTGRISRALKTEFHRYDVNGKMHIANATNPAVPEALAGVVAGFVGLNDFHPRSRATKFNPVGSGPQYSSGSSHYLVPQDWTTIYDVTPLYSAGFNGTGQSIAIIGQTGILLSDIESFRSRYGLPKNDPQLMLYGPDPGINPGDLVEADLDLEWSGAIAPNATIYYVYGQDAFQAWIDAVNLDVAPVISLSYGSCEIEYPADLYRPVSQQANAEGITILNAAGDSGAAGCDDLDNYPYYATLGKVATFPANLPEVTGVGGTLFNDAGGNYWASANSTNFGSALGYIPEAAWNETSVLYGITAGGGGVSTIIPKPAWQAGPGVPNDNARDMPDISMAAAIHDGYYINYLGTLGSVGGTSASSPSLAGVIAILNQYQVSKGFQVQPGLGNINPQLYHLAQSTPSAFHDITSGDNIVPCAQGTVDCLTGSYGYSAGSGYDPVTGLGSVDANNLVTQWNTATNGVKVTLTASPSRATVNDNIQLAATVAAASGSGLPTGTVNFEAEGTGLSLGTVILAPVGGVPTASVTFEASALGPGIGAIDAIYSGDAAFGSGSASSRIRITIPAGASAIELSANPSPVYASPADAQGPSWQTIVALGEVAGVPSQLTGFYIDGNAQPLAKYFPSTSIPANGTLQTNLVLRNLTPPVISTLLFTGIDSAGNTWQRQTRVTFLSTPVFPNFNLSATPLTMTQNPDPMAACQYSQVLTLDETGGFQLQIVDMALGNVDIADQIPTIFGTTRLASFGSLQGTLCWNGITPPATNAVYMALADGFGDLLQTQLNVSFAGPVSNPPTLSATPASVSLASAPVTLSVGITDKTQSWTASVFPGNRTTSWLKLSQYSGTGPAQITVSAAGAGFEPGVYRANIVIQSPNALPQTLTVPVMFVLGSSGGMSISGVTNAFSYKTAASPGMIMAVFGSQLSGSPLGASTQPLPYAMGGVSATINGVGAPLYFVSPVQINLQIPYEAGAGPAVIGVNNNGQIAGFQFQIAPSAPGIVTDGNGNINPTASAAPGAIGVLYVTGDGDVTPTVPDGFSPPAGTSLAELPKSNLPFSVTIGGQQAFLKFVGITPGIIGLTQVNFVVPKSITPGAQPVIVTVNGVSSPPVNITVTASQ